MAKQEKPKGAGLGTLVYNYVHSLETVENLQRHFDEAKAKLEEAKKENEARFNRLLKIGGELDREVLIRVDDKVVRITDIGPHTIKVMDDHEADEAFDIGDADA